MKNNILKISLLAVLGLLSAFSCSRFEEINTNPAAATSEQIQPEYFLNNSILAAQMNPDVAERAFVLYWKGGGNQASAWTVGLSNGSNNDGWTTAYWNAASGWLTNVNLAIKVGQEKAANGTAAVTNNNIIQVARIWRAYLMSEMSDNFGSIPVDGFQGVNPAFNTQKEVYYYMLDELKDAVTKINTSIDNKTVTQQDPAYGYNWDNWIRYANSMRMRLAMRLSEVDAAKAKTEFEAAAATGKYITTAEQNFKVSENPNNTWDDLTAVMSRSWNSQWISPTLNNMYLGLGGIPSSQQLSPSLQSYIKPANYMGVKYSEHFTTMTNDPSAGYWFDGLPNTIDPRAYKTFYIPGNFSDPNFCTFHTTRPTTGVLTFADKSTKTIDAKFTWNALTGGDWGTKSAGNGLIATGRIPALAMKYRGPEGTKTYRIFFANWESYFLIAEAGNRGWSVPMGDEAAYNLGVQESFKYNEVSQFYSSYINSTDFNRVGTSVKYSHTTEPGNTYTMTYIDGKTGASGDVTVNYPSNTIYKGGSVRNDKLTKIITQKFIANTPWLPLETWSDHRRLGLPFFENVAVENPIPTMPALTSGNYTTNQVKFFPQRLRYPSSFRNNDPKNYAKAVQNLGGDDDVFTPMWWAKK